MKLWVIVADGTFDQVCETRKDAAREAKDLMEMGCSVKIKFFEGADAWNQVNAYEEKLAK